MDRTLAPALRRLPQYIYLGDLVRARRVLEVGCGDGTAAAFLARNGASSVIAVDRMPALADAARAKHRLPNLSFLAGDYGALEVEDRSIDVVLVGSGATTSGAELVRWLGFLEEVRRVLAKSGNLILAAPSADRADPGAGTRAGISYHELVQRLEPLFGRVRMVGVSPFLGLSLVEFSEDEEIGELELDTQLTSLGAGRDPVTDYVAVTGPVPDEWGKARGFVVVELPGAEGLVAVAQARGDVGPDGEKLREAERVASDAMARIKELEVAASSARERSSPDIELRRRLARSLEDKTAGDAEIYALRGRLAQAEQEIGRVAAQGALELLEARRDLASLRDRPDLGGEVARLTALVAEKEAAVATAAAASLATPAADAAKAAEVWARAAEAHQAEMAARDAELKERNELVDELERDIAEAQTAQRKAADAASEAQARADALDAELRAVRSKLATLEGEVLARPAIDPETATKLAETASKLADATTQLAEKADAEKKATDRWKAAESKTDELWRKIGEMQKELESTREQSVENARAQRQASQIALTRAVDEASKKLVSVKDELARSQKEVRDLEAKVLDRDGQVNVHEARAAALQQTVEEHAGRIAELVKRAGGHEQRAAELGRALDAQTSAHEGTKQASQVALAAAQQAHDAAVAAAQRADAEAKQAHAAALTAAEQTHAAALAASEQAHATALTASEQAHAETKQASQAALTAAQQAHDEAKRAHEAALAAAQQAHDEAKQQHATALVATDRAHEETKQQHLSALIAAQQAHSEEVDGLRAELAAAGAAQLDAEGELASREKALHDARAELDRVRADLTKLTDELGRAQAALADAAAQASTHAGAATEAREKLALASAELEQAKTQSVMLAAEVEMVRSDLTGELDSHRARADVHETRARSLDGELGRAAADRDRALAALAQKDTDQNDALLRLRELGDVVTAMQGLITTEETRLADLEKALDAIEVPHPAPSPTEAAWGNAQARIRKLSTELGDRDAELLLLHATSATIKKRLSELVDQVKKARADHSGEVGLLLERLAADAAALASS